MKEQGGGGGGHSLSPFSVLPFHESKRYPFTAGLTESFPDVISRPSGPGCSKLTTSLKFQTLISQIS